MELVVVYKANPDSVSQVMRLLRENGFNPVVLENPASTTLYVSKGTYAIHISVPRDEVRGAKSVLRKWEESLRPGIDNLTKKLGTQLFYSVLVVILIATIFYLSGIFSEDTIPLLLLIWFVSFAIIANAEKIWKKLQVFIKHSVKP